LAQKQVKDIPGARKSPIPAFVAPQLATLVDSPPAEDGWLHEIKFDGYRMLCHLDHGKVRFFSRNQKDWSSKFPGVAKVINSLKATTAIIDGEVVMIDPSGRTSFQKLQQAMGRGGATGFIYQVFDLIYFEGLDLTRTPLIERKEVLKELVATGTKSTLLQYSDHQEGNGKLFFKSACEYGLEGIVSKRADSLYVSARNRNWLKVKCSKRQEFVIAGYIPSSKGLPGFGSLILGVYEKGKFIYAGRVGTGFNLKQRAELGMKLDRISRPTMPFDIKPDAKGLNEAHWCEPRVVAEVAFTEWTSDGSIRHPSFQGLREDKKPQQVRRELPAE
jgi:bifunctional non-homologous end joining protein LigD